MSAEVHEKIWERHAREGNLADAVCAYVGEYDWVTFTELDNRLGSFFDLRGDRAVVAEGNPNLVFWGGMSELFCDVMQGLLSRGVLHCHGTSPLTYLIDGGGMNLPVAKSKRVYKNPRWLPVCLRPGPRDSKKPRALAGEGGPG